MSDTAIHFWDLEGTYLKGTPTLSQVTGTLFDKEGRLLISQTAAGISFYSLGRSTEEMALEYTFPAAGRFERISRGGRDVQPGEAPDGAAASTFRAERFPLPASAVGIHQHGSRAKHSGGQSGSMDIV